MMDPTTPPKNIIEQLNAFCQADVKSQWTAKRLKSSRDVCGFSYIENAAGEWVMMPTLCQNCYYTLSQHQINNSRQSYQGATNTKESSLSTLAVIPSPLTPTRSEYQTDDNTSTDYLLYQQNKNNNGLEFYSPSLAANAGCCAIL